MNQTPAHFMHGKTYHGLHGDVTYDLPANASHYDGLDKAQYYQMWRDDVEARGLTLEFREVWGAGFWYAKDAAGNTVGKWTCDTVAAHGYLMNEEA